MQRNAPDFNRPATARSWLCKLASREQCSRFNNSADTNYIPCTQYSASREHTPT
jgi:hypothetical protein